MPPELKGLLKNSVKMKNMPKFGDVEMDIRTDGGYIVVAPSFVKADDKAGAGHYTWERELVAFDKLLSPPQWVIDALVKAASKKNTPTESVPNRRGDNVGSGGDDAALIARARKYLAKMPESISGQGGHNCLLSAATALLHGFGLDADVAKRLLIDDFNPRCQPPWSEREIDHKIDEALKTEHPNERGHLTRKNNGQQQPRRSGNKNKADTKRRHTITLASEILIKPISWLWKHRFIDSKFSIISGEGGKGKSTFLCYMAATISTGRNWIDKASCQQGGVVYLHGEDDVDSVLVPRLKVAGADLRKIAIHRQSEVFEEGQWNEDDDVTVRDVKKIEEIIRDSEQKIGMPVKLLVLDPFSEFLGDTKENNNKEMRNATRRLRSYAEKKGIAIIGIEHHNKNSSSGSAQHRVTGSLAKTSMSRSAWGIYDDPENEGWLLLASSKKNHKGAMAIRFRFVDSDIPDIAKIKFDEVGVNMTANEIELATQWKQAEAIRSREQKPSKLEQSKDFLLNILKDGSKPAGSESDSEPGTIFYMAKQEGHAWGTILRAKKDMNIQHETHFGKSFWILPHSPDSTCANDSTDNPLAQVGFVETDGF